MICSLQPIPLYDVKCAEQWTVRFGTYHEMRCALANLILCSMIGKIQEETHSSLVINSHFRKLKHLIVMI